MAKSKTTKLAMTDAQAKKFAEYCAIHKPQLVARFLRYISDKK